MRWAAWTLVAATVIVYLVMVLWSLPRISGEAGGLTPFDMRPGGYSFDEARAFLAVLSPEGKRFYLDVQHKLDLIYPALMAFSLMVALRWAWRGTSRVVLTAMMFVAIAGAGFDYLENQRVSLMLAAGPDEITTDMVRAASLRSVLKAGLTTVAMMLLLLGLGWRGWTAWRARA
ncbi:MAG: hypothetical protein HKO04_13700 [Silicimonas sp.]|nr:hypothetical protein [Silicimonas sp.]